MTKKVPVESDNTVEVTRKDALEVVVDTLQNRYSEGDIVDTPRGLGVISGVWTNSWEDNGETVEASEDSPAYTVAIEDGGFAHYKASDLESAELPETDIESPEEDLAGEQDTNAATVDAYQGSWNAPPSWEESETPVRIIALDTWSSMGGQFDCGGGACCKGTMRQAGMSERASDEFCASFKDYILGTESWRGWGPD